MKNLVFNDSQHIPVQIVSAAEGIFHARFINTTSDVLKNYFCNEFLTTKMVVREDGIDGECFENYTQFSYIKEMTGRIYEVEMTQKGKSLKERLETVESLKKPVEENTEQITDLQMALCELFESKGV